MPDVSAELAEELAGLGLADRQLRQRISRRVRRLSGDLPDVDALWIDALVQVEAITLYQASQLRSGRGSELGVGDYLICDPLASLGYAERFVARHRAGGARIELALARPGGDRAPAAVEQLNRSIAARQRIEAGSLILPQAAGLVGNRLWVASPRPAGRPLADVLARHGRFSPAATSGLAAQLATVLAALARAGLVHGDLNLRLLTLDAHGRLAVCWPGLRAALRPHEGPNEHELAPCWYETLAPERAAGDAPSAASEQFAAGCIVWQLLGGRSPLVGATAAAKLAAARRGRIADIRTLAPATPPELAELIAAATAHDPARRPGSFDHWLEVLGPTTIDRQRALCQRGRRGMRPTRERRLHSYFERIVESPAWLAALAGTCFAATILTWPAWRGYLLRPVITAAGVIAAGPEGSVGDYAMREQPFPAASAIEPPAANRHLASAAKPDSPLQSGREARSARKQVDAFEANAAQAPSRPPGEARLAESLTGAGERITAEDRPPREVSARQALHREGRRASDVHQVQPAGHLAPDERSLRGGRTPEGGGDLLLAAGRQPAPRRIRLAPGQAIRAAEPHARAVIEVSREGLEIIGDEVRLEDVDFCYCQDPGRGRPEAGMLRIAASRLTLRRCTFSAPSGAIAPPGLTWSLPAAASGAGQHPLRELILEDCVFSGLEAGVDLLESGAVVVEAAQCLFLGPGPWLRTGADWPPDAPLSLALRHCTLRQAAALVELPAPRESAPLPLSIALESSALVPQPGKGVIVFRGDQPASESLTDLRITGHGAIVPRRAALLVWCRADESCESLDADWLRVQGVVRGEVRFSGLPDDVPEGSLIIDWQGPLRSTDPPGIGPGLPAWKRTIGQRRFDAGGDLN